MNAFEDVWSANRRLPTSDLEESDRSVNGIIERICEQNYDSERRMTRRKKGKTNAYINLTEEKETKSTSFASLESHGEGKELPEHHSLSKLAVILVISLMNVSAKRAAASSIA